jgi:hypothetical protein
VAGVEHAPLVVMLHQYGCLPDRWPGGAGGGLAVSAEDPWRFWRAVAVAACGPAGAAAKAPLLGVASQFGKVCHRRGDTQLVLVHPHPSGLV